MTVHGNRVAPGLYRDSIALMRLSSQLQAQPGVLRAAVVMATPANCEALADSGLPAPAELRPDDLLLAVVGLHETDVTAALDWAETELRRPPPAILRRAPCRTAYASSPDRTW